MLDIAAQTEPSITQASRSSMLGTTTRLLLGVLDKHLLKASDVPCSSDSIKRQVRWRCLTSLKRATLHAPIGDQVTIPFKMVGASLDREVSKTELERVAKRNGWRA
jgi:hypothetical protein